MAGLAALSTSVAADSATETTAVGRWPLRPRRQWSGASTRRRPLGAGHRGVDLAGRAGQAVRAALPGRVSYAASLAGRGVVVVDHGDTRTTYEPVRAGVRVGDRWRPVTGWARSRRAGSHCSPGVCLHWGWLRGDDYLDPLRLVGLGPVRLLPLDGSRPLPSPAGRSTGAPLHDAPRRRGLGGGWGQARGWACW